MFVHIFALYVGGRGHQRISDTRLLTGKIPFTGQTNSGKTNSGQVSASLVKTHSREQLVRPVKVLVAMVMTTNTFCANVLNTPPAVRHIPARFPGHPRFPPFETEGKQTFKGGNALRVEEPHPRQSPDQQRQSCAPKEGADLHLARGPVHELPPPLPSLHSGFVSFSQRRRPNPQQIGGLQDSSIPGVR